jgi:hypothetical protein
MDLNLLAQLYSGGGVQGGIATGAGAAGIASSTPGAILDGLLTALLTFLIPVSILVITIAGFYLILGLGNDESRTKARKIVVNTIIGIVLIGLATVIVNIAIGLYQGSPDTSGLLSLIQAALDFILSFVVILAVFVITIAGFYLILGLGNDESRTKARKIILYTIIGIVIISLAEAIVDFALGTSSSGLGDATFLYDIIQSALDVIISYVALIAVATIVIAGFYLLLGLGSDESKTTARKIIIYTITGIIIIGLASAIVGFAISLIADGVIDGGGDPEGIRDAIEMLLITALSYVSLIAVATIVIAGFYLLLGRGSDESKTTARNIIFYTIIAIILMLLSAAIITTVTEAVS